MHRSAEEIQADIDECKRKLEKSYKISGFIARIQWALYLAGITLSIIAWISAHSITICKILNICVISGGGGR
jgi:hypothetical protein